jgi:hypothetical protein
MRFCGEIWHPARESLKGSSFEKDHEEHAALQVALKGGGPDDVRDAFRAMVQTFHIQDVEHLRSSENKCQPGRWEKKHKGRLVH